jgi:hypothetical protein
VSLEDFHFTYTPKYTQAFQRIAQGFGFNAISNLELITATLNFELNICTFMPFGHFLLEFMSINLLEILSWIRRFQSGLRLVQQIMSYTLHYFAKDYYFLVR